MTSVSKHQDGGMYKTPAYPGYPFLMLPDPYLPNGSVSPSVSTPIRRPPRRRCAAPPGCRPCTPPAVAGVVRFRCVTSAPPHRGRGPVSSGPGPRTQISRFVVCGKPNVLAAVFTQTLWYESDGGVLTVVLDPGCNLIQRRANSSSKGPL